GKVMDRPRDGTGARPASGPIGAPAIHRADSNACLTAFHDFVMSEPHLSPRRHNSLTESRCEPSPSCVSFEHLPHLPAGPNKNLVFARVQSVTSSSLTNYTRSRGYKIVWRVRRKTWV